MAWGGKRDEDAVFCCFCGNGGWSSAGSGIKDHTMGPEHCGKPRPRLTRLSETFQMMAQGVGGEEDESRGIRRPRVHPGHILSMALSKVGALVSLCLWIPVCGLRYLALSDTKQQWCQNKQRRKGCEEEKLDWDDVGTR